MIEPSLDMMAGALFELIALARVDEYTEAGWRSETSSQHLVFKRGLIDCGCPSNWCNLTLLCTPLVPKLKLLGGHFYAFPSFYVIKKQLSVQVCQEQAMRRVEDFH